jgi:fatty acid desaturase
MNNKDQQLDLLIKDMARQHQAELPSPGLVWWRAQIQKKLAEKERIERPMVIMRLLVWFLCLVAVGALVTWNWQEIAPATAGSPNLMQTITLVALGVFLFGGSLLFRESAKKS